MGRALHSGTLVPRGLTVEDIEVVDGAMTITARPPSTSAPCPSCGQVSSRLHSRYTRRLADLLERIAWPHDLPMTLACTFEGGSTVAAYPAEEIRAATVAARAVLAAIEAAEITWDLQRIAAEMSR